MADVRMRFELRPDPDGPELGWDLKATSMVNMIAQARDICEEHNRQFSPKDVVVWENQENIEAQKAADAEAKKRQKREEEKAAEILLRAQAKHEAEVEAAAEKLLHKRESQKKEKKA